MLRQSRKFFPLLLLCCLNSCTNYGQLTLIRHLPKALNEVSAVQTTPNSDLIWMLNDGGNSSKLYGISPEGKFVKEVRINAKNHDWEDLTTDEKGNLFIGDFGNN